jgi:hypothetical protein
VVTGQGGKSPADSEAEDEETETGSIVIHYDMPDGQPEAEFRIYRLGGIDGPDWPRLIARNGSHATIEGLAPGKYGVFRSKYVFISEQGRQAGLDQQIVSVEPGRTESVHFTRPAGGRSIEGEITGLPGTDIAGTFVRVKPARAAELPEREALRLPALDLVAASAGRFRTEKLPPGEYLITAETYGYGPSRSQKIDGMVVVSTGVNLPMYVGSAKVTILGETEPSLVRLKMRKTDPSDRFW